jgi:predicted transcriptional regulator
MSEERKRIPKGKRQMLCILDEDVIARVKIAAAKSNSRMSHVVEQAIRQWLARQELNDAAVGEGGR